MADQYCNFEVEFEEHEGRKSKILDKVAWIDIGGDRFYNTSFCGDSEDLKKVAIYHFTEDGGVEEVPSHIIASEKEAAKKEISG